MKGIYFEEKGLQLLGNLGITKAEFARKMGIQRQNVNALFKSNNLEIIARAADVLDVPLALLVGYVEEPNLSEATALVAQFNREFDEHHEIVPEDVPVGDSAEDRRARNRIIRQFYYQWIQKHQDRRIYNDSLNDYIYIKYISINETAGHASLRYLSTLAVLQLDAILPNAILKEKKRIDHKTKNQKGFNSMLIMEYVCPGIGPVRLTVGQKGGDGTKVQYCITAIMPGKL